MSPICGVTRFLMMFQMHDLCGFRWKRFICQLWCHLLILSFLTFQASSSMTLRINRALYVVHYIRYVRITNPGHMRSRHGYNNNNHWCWSTLPSSLAGAMVSFPRTTCGFFPTLRVLYVWLAIHVDPTRWLAHHWSEHSGRLASWLAIIDCWLGRQCTLL